MEDISPTGIKPPKGENTIEITSEELEQEINKKEGKNPMPKTKTKRPRKKMSTKKKVLITVIIILVLAIAGLIIFLLLNQKKAEEAATKHYSILSGEEISDESLNSKPTFCIQTPNGGDVAERTHVGLTQAPIVFEAIAEAGITRFAAVYQNPTSGTIGPIRSLRQYYLEWDTPFDCTVVHAGGSDEALASLKSGDYRDLTEDYDYMWRDNDMYQAPNNLFTSSKLLEEFNKTKKYDSSKISGIARLKPDEAGKKASDNKAAAEPNNSENTKDNASRTPKPLISEVTVNFGAQLAFNVVYNYDANSNSYQRAYANGVKHMAYTCPSDKSDKANIAKECGEPTQVAPKAIAVMEVKESKNADGYHEDITTTGTGKAWIFQNGEAIEGTWEKKTVKDQIEFKDKNGNVIFFTPGQLWISAIPASKGSVKY